MKSFKAKTKLMLLAVVIFFIHACKNEPSDIPFAGKDSSYHLVTEPLVLSKPQKVIFDANHTSTIKPLIKKIDFDKLPTRVFDTSDFRPFLKPPEQVKFNWDSLPERNFDLNKIVEKRLTFKTILSKPPQFIKTASLSLKSSISELIYDFGEEQGLRGNVITCLLQDSKGFIWIETDKGLYQYDGENLWLYDIGSNDNWYSYIIEDKNGKIWIGSMNNGVRVLDQKQGTVRFLNTDSGTSFNNKYVFKMFCDKDNNIWISTWNKGGIYFINQQKGTIKNIGAKQGFRVSGYDGIIQDPNDNIWIAGDNGINIINTKNNNVKLLTKKQGLTNDSAFILMQDKLNNVWITTNRGTLDELDIKSMIIKHYNAATGIGLNLLENNYGQIIIPRANRGRIDILDPDKMMFKSITAHQGLGSYYLDACLLDKAGRLWVGGNSGLNVIGENSADIEHLGKTGITSMAEDSAGLIWIANISAGVDIYDRKTGLAKSITTKQGLAINSMNEVEQLNNETYLCTNKGIYVLDSSYSKMKVLGSAQGIKNENAFCILKDKEGHLLIGGGYGVEVIDPRTNRVKILDTLNGLINNNVDCMLQDRNENVWIGTYNKGIDIFNPKNNTVTHLLNKEVSQSSFDATLSIDDQDRVWIGNSTGLYVVAISNNTLSLLQTPEDKSISGVNFTSCYKGRIYIEDNFGLKIIIPPLRNSTSQTAAWKVESFNKSDGFAKTVNSFNSNLITKNGDYLWGDSGITILRKINESEIKQTTFITGFDVMDQQFNFTETPDLSTNIKDTVWSSNNDTFYLKGQLPKQPALKKGLSWKSLEGSYNLPVDLQLPHNENYLHFYFAGTQPAGSNKTEYRYVLEGIDKKWSDVTDKPFSVNYLNLPPSEYKFKVCSRGFTGLWSRPAEFSFTILPPWWQTWWAYTIYAIVFATAIWLFISYRSRNLKRQNKILEEKVAHRTEQLNKSFEELKSTQAQLIQSEKMASLGELTAGIAHEIQNPLNFVNNFSEVNKEMIEEMKEELAKGNMQLANDIANNLKENEEKINHHGKRADAIVKNMLQHSRQTKGTKEPTDINALCDEYLRLAYHGMRARDKNFNAEFKTDFDASIGKINIIPQDIGRVLLNLFNNAFYAGNEKLTANHLLLTDNYKPLVSVQTKKLNDKVEIRVTDNGNGILQKVLDKIFQPFFTTKPTGEGTGLGLSLSYDIIKAHGGEIKVQTKEGEGSEFIIQLHVV